MSDVDKLRQFADLADGGPDGLAKMSYDECHQLAGFLRQLLALLPAEPKVNKEVRLDGRQDSQDIPRQD